MPRKERKTQEINAGTMADIAFLLLIFFLVTTTIDQELGISRKLAPKIDIPNPPETKERNVFKVFVDRSDRLLVNGELGDIKLLKQRVREFIENKTNKDNLSEKKPTEIKKLGNFPVSKGVVILQNDRGTTFNRYMEVQDVLTRAFNEMRNELSMEKFKRSFDELQLLANDETNGAPYQEYVEAIETAIPISISEAAPREIK